MKKIFRILSFILLFVMSAGLIPVQTVSAADNAVEVTVSSTEVINGGSFTVTVTLNCSKGINAAWFNLNYDTNYFACEGYAGVIPINYLEMDYPTTLTWSYNFKAVQAGTGTIAVAEGGEYADADANPFNPSLGSATVKVWAEGSDDATLSSLQVAGATLSPDFAKWTLDYTCYVDNSVTAVNIGAAASQGGKVEVGGNFENLNVGGNKITVTAYAPNGKTMTYTINVVRLEPPTPPPVTEPPTTTEPETTLAPIEDGITVGGIKYTIDSGYSTDIIPEGFAADVVNFNGKDVLAVVNAKYDATLLYLVNGDGDGRFFLYDRKKKSFIPYTVIDSGVHRYILADGTGDDKEPSGCVPGKVTVGGVEFDALINGENGDFAYFYALSENGTAHWYCYDKVENTVQRLFLPEVAPPEETTPENVTTEAPSKPTQQQTEDKGLISSLENDNNNLKKDNEDLKRLRNLIIAIAAVLIVVMLVIIVVMAAHKSERKNAIDIDADMYADEEDAIDKADAEYAAHSENIKIIDESVLFGDKERKERPAEKEEAAAPASPAAAPASPAAKSGGEAAKTAAPAAPAKSGGEAAKTAAPASPAAAPASPAAKAGGEAAKTATPTAPAKTATPASPAKAGGEAAKVPDADEDADITLDTSASEVFAGIRRDIAAVRAADAINGHAARHDYSDEDADVTLDTSDEDAGVTLNTTDENEDASGDSDSKKKEAEDDEMKEVKTKIEITEDDIKAFEEEAESVKGSLAVEVAKMLDDEGREIQTEIIDLTVEEGEEDSESKQPQVNEAKKPDLVADASETSEDDGGDAENEADEEPFL